MKTLLKATKFLLVFLAAALFLFGQTSDATVAPAIPSGWTSLPGGGVQTPGPVNIGNMGLRPPMYHNANYSALNGDNLLCDTSAGSFTVTLPSSPSVGWMVTLYDVSGSWGTNPLTLAPNGSLLMGTSANYLLQISGSRVTVIYSGSTYGWRVF